MKTLPPDQSVALFDSATALLSSLNAALRGQPFPQLGNTAFAGRATRIGGRLPLGVESDQVGPRVVEQADAARR